MRITHKKTIDRQATGAAQKRLDDARAFAAKEMQELRERRKAVGAKPGEGRVGGGNGDGTGGGKDQPLVLASSSISNGAENVSQNPQIVLTFSKMPLTMKILSMKHAKCVKTKEFAMYIF